MAKAAKLLSVITVLALVPMLFASQAEGAFMRALQQGKNLEMTVGKDVEKSDVTDFYCTWSSSTNPPHFQRYRFYMDGNQPMFYHETRDGGGWPQTKKDITVSGLKQLSDAQWEEFFACIKGGTVKNREEHLESGGSGPWLFLYWKGDRSVCQEFSFASPSAFSAFEDLCVRLKNAQP